MGFTAIPQLVVDFSTADANGRKVVYTIKEGDILKDVVYTRNGVPVTKTGKVTAIMTTETKSSTNYGECACLLKSSFLNHVSVDGFVLDSSDVYDADTVMVFVKDLVAIGEVVNGEVEVDMEKLPEGGINAVLAAAQPGQTVVLPAAEITEALEIPANVVIKGANAGISAATGYRAKDEVEGETVISGPVTIAGDVTLDGVTLSKDAFLKLDKEADVMVRNTRFVGLTSADAKPMLITGTFGSEVLLKVTGCYFGTNTAYHILEGNMKLQSGSYINNSYFAEGCCRQNEINFYEVADNAVITVANNTFEHAANAARIGMKGDVTCTINYTKNTYLATDTQYPEYAGFLVIQPYGKATVSMKGVTINMNDTDNKTDAPQLWYYYQGANDAVLDVANRPKVFINGKLASYDGHSIIDTPAPAPAAPETPAEPVA